MSKFEDITTTRPCAPIRRMKKLTKIEECCRQHGTDALSEMKNRHKCFLTFDGISLTGKTKCGDAVFLMSTDKRIRSKKGSSKQAI
mmetsp:Transcript_10577/g.15854  ORF Transcript_10577/g.15854 Transcript_10577/m.15854 type:complete len:86 (-) Transcript_10577:62-319(-)